LGIQAGASRDGGVMMRPMSQMGQTEKNSV
jgi:hypothetical protein